MAKIEQIDVHAGSEGPNVYLYYKDTRTVTITTGVKWYTRLWFLISNPFRYLFTGKWKY